MKTYTHYAMHKSSEHVRTSNEKHSLIITWFCRSTITSVYVVTAAKKAIDFSRLFRIAGFFNLAKMFTKRRIFRFVEPLLFICIWLEFFFEKSTLCFISSLHNRFINN